MPEDNVPPVPETQNPEAEEVNEEITEEVSPQEEVAETPEEKSEEAKAIKRMQRRIDKITAKSHRTQAENDELVQRLAKYESSLQSKDEYSDDDIEAAVNAKATALAREMAKDMSEQTIVDRKIESVLKSGKSLEKFDDACNAVNKELPFYTKTNKPTEFLSSVLEFKAPERLLHHIGSNEELLEELSELNKTQRVIRLAEIHRDLIDKSKPKQSTAPKPLEPVRATGSADKALSELGLDDFMKRRREQISHRN